jgi:hypothetical protein
MAGHRTVLHANGQQLRARSDVILLVEQGHKVSFVHAQETGSAVALAKA